MVLNIQRFTHILCPYKLFGLDMIEFKKDQNMKTHCTQQSIDLSKIITKKKDKGKIIKQNKKKSNKS